MKVLRIAMLCLAVTSGFASPPAVADDSCTEWSRQDDGTYFRTCVDQDGHQYCQQDDGQGHITRVSCT